MTKKISAGEVCFGTNRQGQISREATDPGASPRVSQENPRSLREVRARSSLAKAGQPLPGPRVRDHASADAGGAGGRKVPGISRRVSGFSFPCKSAAPQTSEGLVRHGVQPPCPGLESARSKGRG